MSAGVEVPGGHVARGQPCFEQVKVLEQAGLEHLVHAISEWTGRR